MTKKRSVPSPAGRPPAKTWELRRQRLHLPEPLWSQPRALVSVSAPAGYGKSTLLSQWREQCEHAGRSVIWLTAAADDRDGSKLLVDFAQRLEQQDPRRRQLLGDSVGNLSAAALLRALLAEVESLEHGAVLFIDDVHELVGHPAEAVLRLLLRHQPDSLLLVLSGRTPVQAAIGTALLEGRLLRFADLQLAFDADEIGALLVQHGIRAREALVAALHERTQGWPAAVRLAALSLQGGTEAEDRFVVGLSSAPQVLTGYLNETVFDRLPPRIHRFLLCTALLRRFDVASARAVSGFDDAAALLEDIETRALPIRRSDDRLPQYVLHPLVRDYLLAGLSQREPDELSRCRRRALDWLLPAGRIEQAIEVCLDSQDLEGAAALISDHAASLVEQYGRHGTYLYWIHKLPEQALVRFPAIRLKQAWSLNFLQRYEEAEIIRRAIEREAQRRGDVAGIRQVEQAIELQRCAEAALRDRSMPSTERAAQWLERWPDAGAFERSVASTVLAFSEKALGQYAAGTQHARQAQCFARECRGHYVLAWASMIAVAALIKQGQCREALLETDRVLAELRPHLDPRAPAVMMLHAMRAGLLYEFNRLDEVGDALEGGLTALVEQSSADPMIIGYVTLARLQAAQGQVLEGIETLYEGEVLGRARQLPRLAIALGAERIVLLLRHGERAQARRQWDEWQRDADLGAAPDFERALMDKVGRIQARFHLAEGRAEEAFRSLEGPLRHARQSGQRRKEVEILVLQSLARLRAGSRAEGRKLWESALSIAMPEGYVRTFVDEGREILTLLDDLGPVGQASRQVRPLRRYRDGLAAAARACASAPERSPETRPETVEPLTERELQIVSRLRAGPSNRQLSDALFITPGTLKWHLTNIYGKLGVTSRLAALARAQELGLVGAGATAYEEPRR